jgi:DNA-binding transcriptional regulator GbsR (MarR family)
MGIDDEGERDALPQASDAELQYVEEVAEGFVRLGLFRMAGRVIGWLLICDPPEQTFDQIAHVLQASKGSISGAMRFLTSGRMVERFSLPGRRRSYYRLRSGSWAELAQEQARHFGEFKKLTENGIALLEGSSPERMERLQAMFELYDWLEQEMPALWERWHEFKDSSQQ